MSAGVASPSEVIAYLCFCIGWDGGWLPAYVAGSQRPHTYLDARRAYAELPRRAAQWDRLDSAQVEIGLPESRRNNGGAAAASVLWAWLEARDSARWAARFKPLPSLVLRIGRSCRRLCIWPLNESVPWVLVESANKRLAYALHAPQKYAQPERLRIPLPGTFIREGRKVPAPVLTTRLELATFERAQVVDRLREPPRPWAERMREQGKWR